MKAWELAIKRCVSDVAFMSALLLILILLPLTANLGKVTAQLPAGVVDEDRSIVSKRVMEQLLQDNFVPFEDEEDLYQAVKAGDLDCGVVLPAGLQEKIEAKSLNGEIKVIRSAQSLTEELYMGQVSACLFAQIAPYITAEELHALDISREEVLIKYHNRMKQGYVFSFEILSQDALPIPENTKAKSLMTGVVAVMIYIVTSLAVITVVHKDARSLLPKLGKKDCVRYVVLPSLVIRTLMICGAITIGIMAAEPLTSGNSEMQMILPACFYAVLLVMVLLLLSLICPDTRVLYLLIFVVLTASVVICPIYIDITVLSPVFSFVREFVPVYWLWKICLIF